MAEHNRKTKAKAQVEVNKEESSPPVSTGNAMMDYLMIQTAQNQQEERDRRRRQQEREERELRLREEAHYSKRGRSPPKQGPPSSRRTKAYKPVTAPVKALKRSNPIRGSPERNDTNAHEFAKWMVARAPTQIMKIDYTNALVFFEKNGSNLEMLKAWKSNHNIKEWREIGLEKPGIGVQLRQGVKRFQHWKQEQQLQASRRSPVRSPPHYASSERR